MSELQLIKSAKFGEIQADIYSRNDEPYMTTEQLGACLGYTQPKVAISKIVKRNPHLKQKEFSGVTKLVTPEGGTQDTRIFTEDGIYEVTMLAKTEKAKEFRAWVRKLLKSLRKGDAKLVSMTEYQQMMMQTRAENAKIRKAQILTRLANQYDGTYKQVLNAHATKELTGEYLLPLNSFGAHLHYEVRTGKTTSTRVNPANYCGVENAKGTYTEQKAESVIGTYYPREDLNVRKGAGVTHAVAEKNGAKYNTAYPVYEIKRVGTQNWGRIGTNRWICLAYCSTAPITESNPAHIGTAYTMTCDWLTVRKSPSTLSKQVSSYKRGETFYVIARKGDWCQLESGNWMCAGKYLKKV